LSTGNNKKKMGFRRKSKLAENHCDGKEPLEKFSTPPIFQMSSGVSGNPLYDRPTKL